MNLNRLKKECDQLKKENTLIALMKMDCLCTQFECETFPFYDQAAEICQKLGATKIYDIGCAYGYQSEVFLQRNMEYVGIEGFFTGEGYWNNDKFSYIEKEYPFKINASETDIAISHLCIGWNCYNFDGIWEEQAKQLALDFKTVLLNCQTEFLPILKKYFVVKCLDAKKPLFLCHNMNVIYI